MAHFISLLFVLFCFCFFRICLLFAVFFFFLVVVFFFFSVVYITGQN